jgi:predicted transcriptional regulator
MTMFTELVNIRFLVNLVMLVAPKIPDWITRLLHQVEGISFDPIDGESFNVSVPGGKHYTFKIRSFPSLSREKALHLISSWKDYNSTRIRPIVASRKLAPPTRDILRQANVSWIEAETGVCHFVAPGILIDTTIEEHGRQRDSDATKIRLRDRSGLIAEAVLTSPRADELRLASIVKQTNVSSGLASRLFRRLTDLGVLTEQGAGPNRKWRLTDLGALLDLWAQEEREVERVTGLYVWSRTPAALYDELPVLNDLKVQWALAGVSAANLYAPTLTTTPNPTIRIDASVPASRVAEMLGGEVVQKGANLQLWQTKGNAALYKVAPWVSAHSGIGRASEGLLQIVSQPRAYIESITGPGRTPDVAQNLRERMIASNA